VHAGECETVGAKFAGIAVAIGARICALVAVREVEALGLDSESFVPSTRMRCRVSTASSSIAVMGRCRSQRTSLKRHSRTLAQATHRDLHPMLGACAAPAPPKISGHVPIEGTPGESLMDSAGIEPEKRSHR
jgi:hypothetical protein